MSLLALDWTAKKTTTNEHLTMTTWSEEATTINDRLSCLCADNHQPGSSPKKQTLQIITRHLHHHQQHNNTELTWILNLIIFVRRLSIHSFIVVAVDGDVHNLTPEVLRDLLLFCLWSNRRNLMWNMLTDLFAGEENWCGCQAQLKIRCSWFPHCLWRWHKVQKIVDELEGETEILSVLEGGFNEWCISSRYCCSLSSRKRKSLSRTSKNRLCIENLQLLDCLQWAMLFFCRSLWSSAKISHSLFPLHRAAWILLVLSHSRPKKS